MKSCRDAQRRGIPRDGRGKDESYGEIFLCSNFLLPLVPPDQSQGLTAMEFPPATGKGTLYSRRTWKGKFPDVGPSCGWLDLLGYGVTGLMIVH